MSNPYALCRGPMQLAIARRIAAGERLAAICAEPGMPERTTVWTWTRRYAWFADEMLRARRQAQGLRVAFREEVGAAFIGHIAAGERVREVLARRDMPGPALYRRWRSGQGHFAGKLFRLHGIHAVERGRRRAAAHARPFDPAMADEIYRRVLRGQGLKATLRADPDFPSYQVITRWRREQREFDRLLAFACSHQCSTERRARSGCTPELTLEIAELVVQGASLTQIARRRHMPSVHTLYAWKRNRPEFAEALATAREAQEDWCSDQVLIAAETATAETVRDVRRALTPLKKRADYLRARDDGRR